MKKIFVILLMGIVLTVVHGCSDDDFPVPPASTVPRFSNTITNDAFAPATVTFKNESIVPERAGTVTYRWSFGDGTSSSEESPTHFYSAPGGYTITLVLVTEKSLEIVEASKTLVIKDPNVGGVPLYFWASGIQTVLLNDQAPVASAIEAPGIGSSYSIAADTLASKLYVGNDVAGKIYVSDLNGNGMTEFRTGIGSVMGMAIDYETSRLYWVTWEGDVKWADLTVSNVSQAETLVTELEGRPTGVAVDPVSRTLFWNNYDKGLWSISLDDEDAVASLLISNPEGGGSVIVVNGRIYYDEYNTVGDDADVKIKSTDLEGKNPIEITSGLQNLIYSGIAYNKNQEKLYWSDRNGELIKRANLDGSGAETFYVSETGEPVAFAIGKKR
jgi:PKD repeat protein